MQKAQLETQLDKLFPEHAAKIKPLIRPSLEIKTEPTSMDDIPIGGSRIGGVPDAPADFKWPEWKGGPLDFLAQFNLAELYCEEFGKELPNTGWLYFFWDVLEYEHEDGCGLNPQAWRVIHFDGQADSLQRIALPDFDPEGTGEEWFDARHPEGFSPCTLTSRLAWVPPHPRSLVCNFDWGFSKDQAKRYSDTFDVEYLSETIDSPDDQSGGHRLLGYANIIQAEVEVDAYFGATQISGADQQALYQARRTGDKSGFVPALDWRLLFQIDTDEHAKMMYGDVGAVYFMLRNDALMNRDFDQVQVVMQCG